MLLTPKVIALRAEDGEMSRALLFEPSDLRPGERRPAVVIRARGLTLHPDTGARPRSRLVEALVNEGYIVLVPNFRSGVGYGVQFREATGYGGSGGTDTLDVIAAGRYLASSPQVDAARIGIFGISYGGYLVTASLARAPDLWSAGVSIVGVGDWQMELELDKNGAHLPFRVSERMKYEDLAHDSSAAAHLDHGARPFSSSALMTIRTAGWRQAIELGQLLRRRGIEVESMVEPGGSHGPATHRQLRARVLRTLDFLDRHLGIEHAAGGKTGALLLNYPTVRQ